MFETCLIGRTVPKPTAKKRDRKRTTKSKTVKSKKTKKGKKGGSNKKSHHIMVGGTGGEAEKHPGERGAEESSSLPDAERVVSTHKGKRNRRRRQWRKRNRRRRNTRRNRRKMRTDKRKVDNLPEADVSPVQDCQVYKVKKKAKQ